MNQPAPYQVLADIRQAHTLPARFYRDSEAFAQLRETAFGRAWHCIGLESDMAQAAIAQPFFLLEGYLDEPLLLVRDTEDTLRCLSNVCTHRGHLLVTGRSECRELRCPYHGRRFGLDGRFLKMPAFEEAQDFPRDADHLPQLPLERLGDLLFTAIHPRYPFAEWIRPVQERVGFLPWDHLEHQPAYGQVYTIAAHWALYVDNYLEGLHIPFVHPSLNRVIDYSRYRYELFTGGNLQVGLAKTPEEAVFDLPAGHPDAGQRVAAYYYWLFPNLMLNVYPWGLSLNLVEPISLQQTRVRFETFVWRPEYFDAAQRDLLHLTELEDEAVVETVQRGMQSRLYQQGRFSPRMEVGVHQFHRLLAEALAAP